MYVKFKDNNKTIIKVSLIESVMLRSDAIQFYLSADSVDAFKLFYSTAKEMQDDYNMLTKKLIGCTIMYENCIMCKNYLGEQ